MKDSKDKKVSVLVSEDGQNAETAAPEDGTRNKTEKLKKPVIFILMGVVFICCMYLIFKPASGGKKAADIGLNEAVPQATGAGLPSDKQKAYEQDMLEQKMQEKRKALASLSDYWDLDSPTGKGAAGPDGDDEDRKSYESGHRRNGNPALNSYRSAQSTLNSFYENNDDETQELRRQIDELKEQLAEKDTPSNTTVQDQLALMEKSYEIAAKYLPPNAVQPGKTGKTVPEKAAASKDRFAPFTPAGNDVVSALYREQPDSAFGAGRGKNRNRGFYTAGISEQVAQPKNSIRAVVQETQTVTDDGSVRLRLLEPAQTTSLTIPAGTVLTAHAKFNNGRLQLSVTSIGLGGNIIPVEITAYDLDGQQGLYVPYSPEMNALREIASNMSQTSGSSIMMTRSAGQQMAGDLSRGLIQGVSGYFSRKVRTPKVTIKAGHQLLLLSK